jgi:hypothetical protein
MHHSTQSLRGSLAGEIGSMKYPPILQACKQIHSLYFPLLRLPEGVPALPAGGTTRGCQQGAREAFPYQHGYRL